MSTTAGTLEQLALKLADILRPLSTHLQQANAADFFRQLGIVVPEDKIDDISDDLDEVIIKSDTLIIKSGELLNAIESSVPEAIIDKGKEIIPLVTALINSFTDIKTALGKLPDIPDISDLPLNIFNLLLV